MEVHRAASSKFWGVTKVQTRAQKGGATELTYTVLQLYFLIVRFAEESMDFEGYCMSILPTEMSLFMERRVSHN